MVAPDVLEAYVKSLGIPFGQNSRSWIFSCPRCSRPKLFFSKSTGRFTCWKCKETSGFEGRPEYAFAELLNQPVGRVKKALYGDEGPKVELVLQPDLRDFYGAGDAPEEEVLADVLPEVSWPFDYYPLSDPKAERGRRYLEGRGIPEGVAARYGVRYAPAERSVAFPVESGGKLYGWQRRLVIPHKFEDAEGREVEVPKSPTMPGMKKERVLMFADRLCGSDHAVLCEGPVDAIKADLCGGNVCAMGKAVGPAQLNLVRAAGVRKVYLALDPDAAEEVGRCARAFADLEVREMFAPAAAGDLGAMSFREVRELFDAAPPVGPGRLFVFLEDRWPTPPAASATT